MWIEGRVALRPWTNLHELWQATFNVVSREWKHGTGTSMETTVYHFSALSITIIATINTMDHTIKTSAGGVGGEHRLLHSMAHSQIVIFLTSAQVGNVTRATAASLTVTQPKSKIWHVGKKEMGRERELKGFEKKINAIFFDLLSLPGDKKKSPVVSPCKII